MKYLGTHLDRKTYYLELTGNYNEKLPDSDWLCFAIANKKPDEETLATFIRATISKNIGEFKGFGLFGGFLHMSFDVEMVKMEVDEQHPEISVMTTGNNETDMADAFWDCYGASSLPDRQDHGPIQIVCVSFDGKDYTDELAHFIERFNQDWLPGN